MVCDPEKGLVRYEFLELLVRIAARKYLYTKIVETKAEALEMLMKEVIKPNMDPKV